MIPFTSIYSPLSSVDSDNRNAIQRPLSFQKARFAKYTPGRALSGQTKSNLLRSRARLGASTEIIRKSGAGHRGAVSEGAVWSFFSRK